MKFNTADADTASFKGTLNGSYPIPTIPADVHLDFRNMVAGQIYQKNSSPRITPLERRAVASVKRDQGITILPDDKGGATVVLDRDAYIQLAFKRQLDTYIYP